MGTTSSRRAPLAAAVLAAGVAALGAAGGAASAARPHALAAVRERPAAVRDYWTAKRMRAARPLESTVTATASSRPSPLARAARRGSIHHEVRHVRRYPNRTNGTVFFTIAAPSPQAGNYRCSGTAVRSPSRSLVWTAGHCVFDPEMVGSTFATNWEFVPAARNGSRPFGEWPAARVATTPQFMGSGPVDTVSFDPRYDLGAAVVRRRGGKLLQGAVGARRIAFRQPRNVRYKAYGYPAEPPPAQFDGRHLFRCDSAFQGTDPSTGRPETTRIRCDMTPGSSGGGWIIHRHQHGYLASVTSYSYLGERNSLYGPYQGRVAHDLYRSAGG